MLYFYFGNNPFLLEFKEFHFYPRGWLQRGVRECCGCTLVTMMSALSVDSDGGPPGRPNSG
jgi:hypothetical protein